MVSTVHLVAFLIVPLAALACEGECIVGITNEYLRLYSRVIHRAFKHTAVKIETQIVPPDNRRLDPISYLDPVIDAFNKTAYAELEHAIFPSYFHGKCLDANDTVPDGCPNPDCPVVCGTPGSMVHFYSKLTYIVYDQISRQLTNLTSPGTKTYQQVKKMVLADAQRTQRRASSPMSAKFRVRAATTEEKRFRAIMKSFAKTMLTACDGPKLRKCRWDTHMKKFILRYP